MSATHAPTDLKFELHVEPERDAVRVCPHGEVDLATTGAIREKFEEMNGLGFRRIALDLRDVTFLDSSGVRLVLELLESSRAAGWRVRRHRRPGGGAAHLRGHRRPIAAPLHRPGADPLRALGAGMSLATQPVLQATAGRRTIALLDLDPELGARMTPERFAMARHEARAISLTLRRGEWAAEEFEPCADVGFLVVDGVLAREVMLEDTVSTELLGPGDLIRLRSDDESCLLRQRVRWQVLAEARLAVLGASFAKTLLRYPELSEALTDRALARSQRLATTQAISHLNSVERRVCALLWHLAERWGRVTGDGIVVPLTLSHRLLGELVGARRPTVSTALAALERQGKVRRREDATWLLTGEPPGTPAAQVRRVVAHRRRLLSQQAPALSLVDGQLAHG